MTRDLAAIVDRFAGVRVAVIGDGMLDTYLAGRAGRLCREAPVPIVTLDERHDAPGGAANTAANLRQLGATVRYLGVIGDDDAGARLRNAMAALGMEIDDLVVEPSRATLHKQRVLADGQLLVRVDDGSTAPLAHSTERRLLAALAELHAWADALVVSDYAYGVVSDALVARLAELRSTSRGVLVADAKDVRRVAALRPTAVKPNYAEACALVGQPSHAALDGRAENVTANTSALLAACGAENIVVTLDGDGSLLIRPGCPPYRTYARPVSNDRAAGAGDTVAATLALALAVGAAPPQAVDLAAAAASVAVAKPRTATCTAEELRALLAGSKQPASLEELGRRLDLERSQGRTIVFTNGCFDILHPGHVTYLGRAKALGDVLVVAVNSDDSVRRLKGPGRPVNSLADRMAVLAGLGCIDYLIAFEHDTPMEVIASLRPDIVTKGGDYTEDRLPEAQLVRRLGGEVRILPFVDERSTTRIIERIGAVTAAGISRAP